MIVVDKDPQTPVAWQKEAYHLMNQPKKLITLKGRHYDPHTSHLGQTISAAINWFDNYLK